MRNIAVVLLLLGLALTSRAETDSELIEAIRAKGTGTAESILFFSQEERRVAFKSIEKIYPTREVRAGSNVYPLPSATRDLSGVTYTVDDKTYSLADFLAMPYSQGLIVVQDGKVLLEHYDQNNSPSTRWISFSVTKSVTSMLIGAAIADGYIDSVDEPVANYLPRLRGTPYETATIENVLQMASGVKWDETYADPESDVAKAGGANGIALVNYLATLPAEHPPGEVFNYNTGETNLVGEILRAAIGNNASTYLEHKIWQPFGMEFDANWFLGGPGGGEAGGCCISATLRDYARIGLFAMHEGRLRDGTQVLPPDWMTKSTTPSKGAPYYGYLWWLYGNGNYSAQGIFNQHIGIYPSQDLVIAAHSNAPAAVETDYGQHLSMAIRALAAALGE